MGLSTLMLPASVLMDGERFMVDENGLRIGRDDDNDVVIDNEWASRHHAVIERRDGNWTVSDLGSRNGTKINGERFRKASRTLRDGDAIAVAGRTLRFLSEAQATHVGATDGSGLDSSPIRITGERVSIGRHPSNQVVLDDPNISRFQAELTVSRGQVELRDLGSRNGTRLNGELVSRAPVRAGDEIGIGPFRLLFDGAQVIARDDRGSLRLDATDVTVDVGSKRILQPTSLAARPGQFIAVVGESGSGKSTLVKALAGIRRPSSGAVTINGDPVAGRQTDIGYVPQDEIVHEHLTVHEALRYAARLRLPQDTSARELESTISHVVHELGLQEKVDTRIGDLSGGQRKRAGVAVELLSQPGLLLLDEPTTGLDPGLETRTMNLLRELADSSRAIVAVTHATKNLGLCDQLVVMGRGGVLCYAGAPSDALRFFETDTFDGIYTELERSKSERWAAKFKAKLSNATGAMSADHRPHRPGIRGARSGKLSFPREVAVLSARYARLLVRDRRNLAILFGQVPLLAAALVGLFQHPVFAQPNGNPRQAAQLLFLMLTIAIWFGSIDAAREIVKERAVFERERAIGVRLSSYLASKAVVLFTLSAVQCIALATIVLLAQPLHEPASAYVLVIGLTVLSSWVAVGMGLVLSAGVRTQDQATSFIPLALIPQLLFGGAIVPIKAMGAAVAGLSWLIFARWSFAGTGAAVHLGSRLTATPTQRQLNPYGHEFFDLPVAASGLALAAFVLCFFLISAAMLRSSRL